MRSSAAAARSLAYSYGHSRFEVLASFTNGAFLLFVCVFLVAEALHRFIEPRNIHTDHIGVVALAGLVVNVAGFFLLAALPSSS